MTYSENQNDPGITETYFNLSVDPISPRYVAEVLAASNLVRVSGAVPDTALETKPDPTKANDTPYAPTDTDAGNDGSDIDDNAISLPSLEASKQGLWVYQMKTVF